MMLDGPRMPPAAGGKPTMLVVLLHGYGSNGEDLIGLAPYWAKLLPNAQFVAPNAPEPVPMAPGGYQWFPIPARMDPRVLERGLTGVGPGVERFLERELQRYALTPDRLALVGFSQGTMLALHMGLSRPTAGVLGYSGLLASPAKTAKAKPPILLVHGDQDDMIPLGAMFHSADSLAEAGLGAQWHVSYGTPHAIGPDGLELGGAFLKACLSGKYAAAL